MSERKTYDQQHRHCPRCGKRAITHTWPGEKVKPGQPHRDNAGARCEHCGWEGIVHYLKPEGTPVEATLTDPAGPQLTECRQLVKKYMRRGIPRQP